MSYFKAFNVADAYKGLRYDMKKKQWVKSYATGGKVEGTGPKLAVLHGGEVVLTPSQQKSIAHAKTQKAAAAVLKRVQQKKKAKPSKAAAHKAITQALKKKK